MTDARHQLEAANAAITTAVLLLSAERATFERFMKESRDMESFGPILNTSLFMSSERQATEALLKPLYKAALDFLRVHEAQMAAARSALEKVKAHG